MQKSVSTIAFKQLQCHANTHYWRHFNKQVDMVNSNMQFINSESMPVCTLPDEKLTIHSDSVKLQGISCVFNFPDKMKGILSEAVAKTFQFHFLTPKTFIRSKVLTMFVNLFHGDSINPRVSNNSQELNLLEGRIPPMFENMGTLRQM